MSFLRKLAAHDVRYAKHDSVFPWIEDLARAQRLANRFASLKWPAVFHPYARRVTPQLQDVLRGCQYYWTVTQPEWLVRRRSWRSAPPPIR